MTILHRSSGIVSAPSNTWTVARSAGNFGVGTVLVVAIFSNTVFTTPGGWARNVNDVNFMGNYAYDRVAAGEASFDFTCAAAGAGQWYLWELSAGSSFVVGQATQTGAFTLANYDTPLITPTAGNRHLMAVAGGNSGGKSVTGWSNSFVGWGGGQATGGDSTFSQAADRAVTADGTTAYNTTATFNAALSDRAGMTLAYVDSAGDVTPPSVPTGLTVDAVSTTTADLSWTASTGSPTGYEIEITEV